MDDAAEPSIAVPNAPDQQLDAALLEYMAGRATLESAVAAYVERFGSTLPGVKIGTTSADPEVAERVRSLEHAIRRVRELGPG